MGKSTKADQPSESKESPIDKTLKSLKKAGRGKKAESPPEPEKKKRGHYKERECPYCHKFVRNLGNHIKMKHPAESPEPPEVTKEELLGVPTEKPPESRNKKVIYYCNNCHAEVRKGENQCWKCGETLIWEGIE